MNATLSDLKPYRRGSYNRFRRPQMLIVGHKLLAPYLAVALLDSPDSLAENESLSGDEECVVVADRPHALDFFL